MPSEGHRLKQQHAGGFLLRPYIIPEPRYPVGFANEMISARACHLLLLFLVFLEAHVDDVEEVFIGHLFGLCRKALLTALRILELLIDVFALLGQLVSLSPKVLDRVLELIGTLPEDVEDALGAELGGIGTARRGGGFGGGAIIGTLLGGKLFGRVGHGGLPADEAAEAATNARSNAVDLALTGIGNADGGLGLTSAAAIRTCVDMLRVWMPGDRAFTSGACFTCALNSALAIALAFGIKSPGIFAKTACSGQITSEESFFGGAMMFAIIVPPPESNRLD